VIRFREMLLQVFSEAIVGYCCYSINLFTFNIVVFNNKNTTNLIYYSNTNNSLLLETANISPVLEQKLQRLARCRTLPGYLHMRCTRDHVWKNVWVQTQKFQLVTRSQDNRIDIVNSVKDSVNAALNAVYVPPLSMSLKELRDGITHALQTITADMLHRVWDQFDYRVDVCRVTQAAHIEGLWLTHEKLGQLPLLTLYVLPV
jgi:hypothetical protein